MSGQGPSAAFGVRWSFSFLEWNAGVSNGVRL